jgi:hypothetical protein
MSEDVDEDRATLLDDELVVEGSSSPHARTVPAGPLRNTARPREDKPPAPISEADGRLRDILQMIVVFLGEMPAISEDTAWREAMQRPVYDTVKLYSDREASFRKLLEDVVFVLTGKRQVANRPVVSPNHKEVAGGG